MYVPLFAIPQSVRANGKQFLPVLRRRLPLHGRCLVLGLVSNYQSADYQFPRTTYAPWRVNSVPDTSGSLMVRNNDSGAEAKEAKKAVPTGWVDGGSGH
jgi:hypothetical protein